MSTFTVTAEPLAVYPHPNADSLELAQVGLYKAVVPKGRYTTGDWAIYIPESAVLPSTLLDELGLAGKLAGSTKNRVKAIRLRGEVSQGIVCSPKVLAGVDLAAAHKRDHNFADELGIEKYVPPVPVHLSGEVKPAPDLLPWVEIENISRYPTIFTPGELVVATEKIHGTACLLTWTSPGDVVVSSKGYGNRKLSLVRNEKNLYWRTIEGWDVPAAAEKIAQLYSAEKVGIFAEIFGKGVQDLWYGADAKSSHPGYGVFDVSIVADRQFRWLHPDELYRLASMVGLPLVPRIYEGPYREALLVEKASGLEKVTGKRRHIREGIVVRPVEERYSEILGGRAIGKLVSEAYLMRKGGTEYE